MPTMVRRRISKKRPPPTTMPGGVRRRVSKKRAPVPVPSAFLQAIRDEGLGELVALSSDARRKHIHWVHVRTHDPGHKQPQEFTRKEFFEFMLKVYKEVYPEPANPTGSILLFGVVAKERHADSPKEEERSEHIHAPAYCTVQHYWHKVAKRALDVYNVKLHAACHEGYTTMYQYVRAPSVRKPLSELDSSCYLSDSHPRGEVLRRLLQVGEKSVRAHRGRTTARGGGGAGDGTGSAAARIRPGDVYGIVQEQRLASLQDLQLHAQQLSSSGDARLAQLLTSMGIRRSLECFEAAHALIRAPATALSASMSLMDKLRRAATHEPCMCAGVWKAGAANVLANNMENIGVFCGDIREALTVGAKRGVNMGIVGGPGMGKSMLFESLDSIFVTGAKPQRRSTFPLSLIPHIDILVWQEYTFYHDTVDFDDLLNLCVGEKLDIRNPGAPNKPWRNRAPMFYTAPRPISAVFDSQEETAVKNKAMAERFKIRHWYVPIPFSHRQLNFPRCGRCCAEFVLNN